MIISPQGEYFVTGASDGIARVFRLRMKNDETHEQMRAFTRQASMQDRIQSGTVIAENEVACVEHIALLRGHVHEIEFVQYRQAPCSPFKY